MTEMSNTPRSKATQQSPLTELEPNIGEASSEDEMIPMTRMELQAIIGESVAAALAQAREAAAESVQAVQLKALGPAEERAAEHLSSSGRAPKIAAKDRTWVTLDDNDEIPPGGLFVAVNGVGYMLTPGVEMHVPNAVLEVLDNAIKSVPVFDVATRRIIDWKPRKRFSYSVARGAAAA